MLRTFALISMLLIKMSLLLAMMLNHSSSQRSLCKVELSSQPTFGEFLMRRLDIVAPFIPSIVNSIGRKSYECRSTVRLKGMEAYSFVCLYLLPVLLPMAVKDTGLIA